jgi:hypothetical protein
MNVSYHESICIPDVGTYSGFIDNASGTFHGYGICEFVNGDRYEGGWVYGNMQGWGVQTFSLDDPWKRIEYMGGMWGNEAEGFGKMTYSDGRVYEGGWKQGKRHGWGDYMEPQYGRYIGGWNNDEGNGYAMRERSNGSRYAGGYKDGKRQGYGWQIDADATVYYGGWDNDLKVEN